MNEMNSILVDRLNDINFFQSLDDFEKNLQNQQNFICDYLKLFEVFLLFRNATRQYSCAWHL